MNQQTLKGNWNEIKGKITEKWGDLTENDLQSAKGSVEQLVGMIQRKTGDARESIQEYIDSAMSSDGMVAQAVDSAREYANAAVETVQDRASQVADQARAGYEQTTNMVRQHPAESLAVSFGVGILTGVVAGLILRSR